MNRRFSLLLLLLALSIVLALTSGAVSLPLSLLVKAPTNDEELLASQILWQLRLPRLCMALLAGAALALSGALLQSISRNQLADPYLFGLVSGAGVGIALQQLVWPELGWSVPLAAFLGACASATLVLACYRLSPERSMLQLLLAGIAVSFLSSALLSLLLYLQSNLAAGKILFWLMGSVANAHWQGVQQLTLTLAVTALVLWCVRRDLLALSCSDSFARSVGVATGRLQTLVLLLVCALTAVTVSYCGGIALVGLVIPQLIRKLVGGHLFLLLPASAIGGAAFLVIADTAARQMMPSQELPLGVVCSGAGAVFFLLLLLRKQPS